MRVRTFRRRLITFLECAGVLAAGSVDLHSEVYDTDADPCGWIMIGARQFLRAALRDPVNNSLVVDAVLGRKEFQEEWSHALPDLTKQSVLDLDDEDYVYVVDADHPATSAVAALSTNAPASFTAAAPSASASAPAVAMPAIPLPTSAVEIAAATAQALRDNIRSLPGSIYELCSTFLKEDAPLAAAARAGQLVQNAGRPQHMLCLLDMRLEDNKPGIRIVPRTPHMTRFLVVAGVLPDDDGDGWIPVSSYAAVCAGVYAYVRELLQDDLTQLLMLNDLRSKTVDDPSRRLATMTMPAGTRLTVDDTRHFARGKLLRLRIEDDDDDDAGALAVVPAGSSSTAGAASASHL